MQASYCLKSITRDREAQNEPLHVPLSMQACSCIYMYVHYLTVSACSIYFSVLCVSIPFLVCMILFHKIDEHSFQHFIQLIFSFFSLFIAIESDCFHLKRRKKTNSTGVKQFPFSLCIVLAHLMGYAELQLKKKLSRICGRGRKNKKIRPWQWEQVKEKRAKAKELIMFSFHIQALSFIVITYSCVRVLTHIYIYIFVTICGCCCYCVVWALLFVWVCCVLFRHILFLHLPKIA